MNSETFQAGLQALCHLHRHSLTTLETICELTILTAQLSAAGKLPQAAILKTTQVVYARAYELANKETPTS